MIEADPDPQLDRQVAAVLADLTPAAVDVLTRQGRRVSDRLAADALRRHLDQASSADIRAVLASGAPRPARTESRTEERRRERVTARRPRPGDWIGRRNMTHAQRCGWEAHAAAAIVERWPVETCPAPAPCTGGLA